MISKIFVDTSFLIALVNGKDQYHTQAQHLAERHLRHYLITTDAVLLEIGNALAKTHKIETIEIIRTLRNSPKTEVIAVNNELFEKGLDIYEKFSDKDWGLVDCLSFAVMWEREIFEVLTFDDDFKQAGFIILEDKN